MRAAGAFIEISAVILSCCARIRAMTVGRSGMPKLDEQISTLEEKFKQFKLRQQRANARQKAIEAERERKVEMRRKVLVGGIVLAKVREGVISEALFREWIAGADLRADDRALFGLEAAAGEEEETAG
jgi:hypothetical protein